MLSPKRATLLLCLEALSLALLENMVSFSVTSSISLLNVPKTFIPILNLTYVRRCWGYCWGQETLWKILSWPLFALCRFKRTCLQVSVYGDDDQRRSSLLVILPNARICLAYAQDDSVYESVLKIFRETDLHEEKERCMRALGASHDPKLLQRTLDFSMSSEVRSQDTVFVIGSVAANPKGRDLVNATPHVQISAFLSSWKLTKTTLWVVCVGLAICERQLESVVRALYRRVPPLSLDPGEVSICIISTLSWM